VDKIITMFDNEKDTMLFIKWHPREDVNSINIYVGNNSDRVINFIYEDIQELIMVSDACLVLDSSAGLDVLLHKKPLIEINLNNEKYGRSYAEKKVALLIDREEKLSLIKDVLFKKIATYKQDDYDLFLDSILFKRDGKSAVRIADLISKMV